MSPRLKSLELQGYKTFASKTHFEYPANITAIVGPNGAGKSNVADSLRWVLGEQTYSLLRGKKTEDMIFAGSEQRPKASMASATIEFDNEDGWLPIDFSHVSITRRAYRDGQNEYYLNGQKVRLREISELLAKAGLAERTYTIIGQGLVDAALSLKPDERRRFFEEAAGIGLYRSRREEALTRLNNTQRNLERVKDILSELEPRLNSLERQAKRVDEYDRIKADLQVLLREWYGFKWHATQKELREALKFSRLQEEDLLKVRQEQQDIENQISGVRSRLQEMRKQLNLWHSESAELHNRREQVSRNLAVSDERKRAMLEQQKSLEAERVRVEEEIKAAQERFQVLLDELARLEEELAEAQAAAEKARKDLRERQVQRSQMDETLNRLRRSQVSAQTRQAEINAQLQELHNRAQTVSASIEASQGLIEKENQALQTARETQDKWQAEIERLNQENRQVEEAFKALRQETENLETKRKKIMEHAAQLKAEKSRLQAQIQVLEQAEQSFSGLNQGARFILEAAKKGQLRGSFKALSPSIEVPAEFETAMAAVFGDLLDGVVLPARENLEEALALLEKGKDGRAILLPLDSIRGDDRVKLSKDADVLGVAADLIRTSDDLQPVIKKLLGNVLVVRNRSAAVRLEGSLPENARMVTLRGEVFWGNGMVSAGQDNRSAMIARPRQKRELTEALENIVKELAAIDDDQQKVEQDLEEMRFREKEQQKNANEISSALKTVNQQWQQAHLAYEQARQRQSWQREQLDKLQKQLQAAREETRQKKSEQQDNDKKIARLETEIKTQVRSLAQIPMDEMRAQLAHWETNSAVATRAKQEAERRIVEHRQSVTQAQQRQKNLAQRMTELTQSLTQMEENQKLEREQDEALSRSIETLQEKITPADQALEQQESDYSLMQQKQLNGQQALSLAERNHTHAQLELTRQREALDNLRSRIEDDFGLVAFEYDKNVSGPTPLPLDFVKQLPVVEELSPDLEENIRQQRSLLRRLGAVNTDAKSEYASVQERFEFLTTQVDDLQKADADLRAVIAELDELMRIEFKKTFDAVASEFKKMFTRLFGGGSARLLLTNDENPTEAGIDIQARLPGRREQDLSLLSGGERSLTAVALIFSLLRVSPTPFCVMDEVDAMLDEANVGRFCDLLKDLSQTTQFIVITHNRNTVQTADVIYGVTMGRDSTSQVISLRLDEVSEDMVK